MRIALFTDTYLPQVNGVSRTLARLVRWAQDRGQEIGVVSPSVPGQEDVEADLHLGCPSLPVPFYSELRVALPGTWGLSRRLDAFRPDLVHVATEFSVGWTGANWARDRQVPLVTSFHTNFPAYLSGYGFGGLEAVMWDYLRAFHDPSRITFCPSRAIRRELLDRGFGGSVRVWSRGVDAKHFRPGRRCRETRERMARGADELLVYVGRLAPEKRLDVLLEAFAGLREERGDRVALALVGDGPERPALEEAAPGGVHFTGYLDGDDLARAFAAGDLFVFPSDTETFGNVVLEAMASGLPVVAPARGGVLDTVEPGVNGSLVSPRDPDDLARATVELLDRPARRRRMAEAARRTALSRSWDAVFRQLFADYGSAVGSGVGERVA